MFCVKKNWFIGHKVTNIDRNRQKSAGETLGMAYFGHPVGGKFFINKIAIEIGLLSEF